MRTCINDKECIFNNICSNYQKRLLKTISPVIKGIKPAEIISIPKIENNMQDKLELLRSMIKRCDRIEGKVIDYSNKSYKVFIYNENSLENILHRKNIKKFLAKYGYNINYCLQDYLDTLYTKICKGEIPDEIGIFLGYPLKDVMGFMGVSDLPLTKINYWRIYGDANISDKLYDNIQKVKQNTEKLLIYKTPQQVFELLIC